MPYNGEVYELSDEATGQLKEIADDDNLQWDPCEEEGNNLEICTTYNHEKVSLLKKILIELAKDKCGFVRRISSFS
jgi:hypothetical protein